MSPPLFTRRSSLAFAATVAAGLGASWWLRGRAPTGPALTLTPVVRDVLDDPGSPGAGPADADLTLVVFTDYRCTICQATDDAIDGLLAEDPRARVIFKDWPIRGPDSDLAARAALAAARQGRYRALHTALMASRGPLDPVRIETIAAAAGLDVPRLRADLADHADLIGAQLARHAFQAFSLGLQGTPAYIVGRYLMQGGLDDRRLAAAVRRARRAGPPT